MIVVNEQEYIKQFDDITVTFKTVHPKFIHFKRIGIHGFHFISVE